MSSSLANTFNVFVAWIFVQRGKVGLFMSATLSTVVSQIGDSEAGLGSGLNTKRFLLRLFPETD